MKRFILLGLLVLMMIPLTAVAQERSDVEVSLQRHEPFPAEPGTYTDVYLLVKNNFEVAKNLQLEFIPEYPFTIATGDNALKKLGDLDSLKDTFAVVQYRVDIAPDAINKNYNFTVYSSTFDGKGKVKWEFPIAVRGSDASVTLESYLFTPKEIKPGETANLDLVLRNTGQGDVKDLDVTLDFDDGSVTTIGSGTTKRINRIETGKSAEVSFNLIIDGSSPVEVKNIPVNLQYRDRLNTKFNRSTNLGMIVKAHPTLGLRLDSTTLKSSEETGDVSVQVVNSGIVDLRYVTLELLDSMEYEVLSYANDVYIGNLDSDDFEIAEFKIKPKVKEPMLKFKVDFKDPYNTDYEQDYDLPLRIITPEELGEQKNNTGIIVLILIAGAVVAYLFYRSRKRKRHLAHRESHSHPPQKTTKRKRR